MISQSLTNNADLEFITKFYSDLDNLITSTITNGGANICLNYAVFRTGRVNSDYFMETFNRLFNQKVLILNYQ